MRMQSANKWRIGFLVGVFDHVIEVTHRLVRMDDKSEGNFTQFWPLLAVKNTSGKPKNRMERRALSVTNNLLLQNTELICTRNVIGIFLCNFGDSQRAPHSCSV
jgi:hypothetical protein